MSALFDFGDLPCYRVSYYSPPSAEQIRVYDRDIFCADLVEEIVSLRKNLNLLEQELKSLKQIQIEYILLKATRSIPYFGDCLIKIIIEYLN